ncbi:MAG: translesion DNA synthesis-associated protein ImuA [Pseudomonadales bacterium]
MDICEANTGLSHLLQHPALWRAGQLLHTVSAHPSGYPLLDKHLPSGGWPKAGLTELLLDTVGIGELRLLAPLIRHLTATEPRWVIWIDPPFVPYAPALAGLGIMLERLLIVHTQTHEEALWALEQASRSGACSLALAWLDERRLKTQQTRRLQFAALQGGTLACLFRPAAAAAHQSMAELRLELAPTASGALQIDIRKRRGGWPVSGLCLEFERIATQEPLEQLLAEWRRGRQSTHRPPYTARPISAERVDPLSSSSSELADLLAELGQEEASQRGQLRVTH